MTSGSGRDSVWSVQKQSFSVIFVYICGRYESAMKVLMQCYEVVSVLDRCFPLLTASVKRDVNGPTHTYLQFVCTAMDVEVMIARWHDKRWKKLRMRMLSERDLFTLRR
jgi:hypothetical protein